MLKIQGNLINTQIGCFTLTASTCMWKNQNLHPTHHKVSRTLELHHRHCTASTFPLPLPRGPWEYGIGCGIRVGYFPTASQHSGPGAHSMFFASMPQRQYLSSARTLPEASKGEEVFIQIQTYIIKTKTFIQNQGVLYHHEAAASRKKSINP